MTYSTSREPIAIIGIGCRFPGARNPRELWDLVWRGGDMIRAYPGNRFPELDEVYRQAALDPSALTTARGGFLTDIDRFDPAFFGVSPRESIYLDPQLRLLLEVVWEALEDGGQLRERYQGSPTAVYAGVWTSDYENYLYQAGAPLEFYATSGSGRAALSGRVSYAFGLEGPSVTLDTACSSSLVAVHLACQSLWSGESRLAIAAGANLILASGVTELFSNARMLAPDGRCKFGDEAADGFVRSEGAGAVVLKPLAQAVADRDPIYALIRGSAVNNDGRSSGSMITPSRHGQQAMLRAAWQDAAIDPRQIRYIEAHGTGTSVGDPVEIEAIGRALAEAGVVEPCLLGSIKTNIGHTESAAGIAGLLKAALMLERRSVPRSLHLATPNPKIAWHELPIALAREAGPLSAGKEIAMVGVSAFGLTGTNAHVVLEEWRGAQRSPEPSAEALDRSCLLPVSAATAGGLAALLEAYRKEFAGSGTNKQVRDVAYTAAVRRSHHAYRAALTGETPAEMAAAIECLLAKQECAGASVGQAQERARRVVFVVPGQGSQWFGMARGLFRDEPVFRRELEDCDAAIFAETGWSLLGRLFGSDAEAELTRIAVVQPALFAISVALAALWRAWGIEPDAVVGHSMGEVAAAYIAGVLNLADAVAVICRRSALLATLSGTGSMATVELSIAETEQALAASGGAVSIAASNSPQDTVISGDPAQVEAVLEALAERAVFSRRIKVNVASHSAEVDPILKELEAHLASIKPHHGHLQLVSTVEAMPVTGQEMDAAYWVRNLRRPVLFGAAIAELVRQQHDIFIELSPHPILLPAIRAASSGALRAPLVVSSLRREQPERATLLAALGLLYTDGYPVEWQKFYRTPGDCVRLPQYPFERERCWFEAKPRPSRTFAAPQPNGPAPLLGRRIESALEPDALLWETEVGGSDLGYLDDHRVAGSVVFPATAYLEMALEAGCSARPGVHFDIGQASFLAAAYTSGTGSLVGGDSYRFQISLLPEDAASYSFEIRGRAPEVSAWTLHATGTLTAADDRAAASKDSVLPSSERPADTRHDDSAEDHYAALKRSGLEYGPGFRLVEQAWVARAGNESWCHLATRAQKASNGPYIFHPAVLDGCLQAVARLLPAADSFRPNDTFLPVSIENFTLTPYIPPHDIPADGLWAHARLESADAADGSYRASLRMWSDRGQFIGEIAAVLVQRVAQESRKNSDELLFGLDWIEDTAATDTAASTSSLTPGFWLILADRAGAAAELRSSLTALGQDSVFAFPGAESRPLPDGGFEINLEDNHDFDRLLAPMVARRGLLRGIVHLWSYGEPDSAIAAPSAFLASQARGSFAVTRLLQAIARLDLAEPPRLWLVTGGAMHVAASDKTLHLDGSPLWGLGRAVAREHPELRATLVDLSPAVDPAELRALARYLALNDKEDQIALREERRYVARLTPFLPPSPAAPRPELLRAGEEYRIHIGESGVLDQLELRAFRPSAPAPGEVAIEVSAAGLNFIDVAKVMGIYPGLDPSAPVGLGAECAGRVCAVGAGVTEFRPGDEVVALTPAPDTCGMFASRVCVPAELAAHRPAHLAPEAAATLAIAYMTADYGLHELARLEREEWVLIHAAAGGVGLAAIELAQRAGARIIATAGAPEKHAYLASLGVEHVLTSRSLAFARGVDAITGGRGVDVVLNSLAGDFVRKNLDVLAPYGRFVELGKQDIYADRRMSLGPFKRNLSYFAVDLAAMIYGRRPYISRLFRRAIEQVAAAHWRPLPVTTFSSAQPAEAFRFLAQARHIGKLAIRFDRPVKALPSPEQPLFRAAASYLITGGLGGVGLAAAEWMVEKGARHLVLASRRTPSDEALAAISRMRAREAIVLTVEADVSDRARTAELFATIRRSMPPLKGVLHAAAAVDDALLLDLSPERFWTVMAPKIAGAWHLDEQTRDDELDFFVLFSSIAALYPQPGHASYAAANAYLDAFAVQRRAGGRPATSINWGGWQNTGLARASGTLRSIDGYAMEGLTTFTRSEGLGALETALACQPTQLVALSFDRAVFAAFHSRNGVPRLFATLVEAAPAAVAAASGAASIPAQFAAAPTAARGNEILEAFLTEEIGRVLKLSPDRIDPERPLGALGLDSLMALEFVRRLQPALGFAVPASAVFNYPTVRLFTAYVARRLDPATDALALQGQAARPKRSSEERASPGGLPDNSMPENAVPANSNPENFAQDLAQIEDLSEEDAVLSLIATRKASQNGSPKRLK